MRKPLKNLKASAATALLSKFKKSFFDFAPAARPLEYLISEGGRQEEKKRKEKKIIPPVTDVNNAEETRTESVGRINQKKFKQLVPMLLLIATERSMCRPEITPLSSQRLSRMRWAARTS